MDQVTRQAGRVADMLPPPGEWARPLCAAFWDCVPRAEDGAGADSLRLQRDAQKLF